MLLIVAPPIGMRLSQRDVYLCEPMRRLLFILLLLSGCASAPFPPNTDPYTPITIGLSGPNFRAAVDNRFNGTNEIDPQLGTGSTIAANGVPFSVIPHGTVASLPGGPVQGQTFGITDCDMCTWGGTCVHSASPPVPLCPEIYDGTVWRIQ